MASNGAEDGTGFEIIDVVDALVGGELDLIDVAITGAEEGAGGEAQLGAPVGPAAVVWSRFGSMLPDGCMEAVVMEADRWFKYCCDGSVLVDVVT